MSKKNCTTEENKSGMDIKSQTILATEESTRSAAVQELSPQSNSETVIKSDSLAKNGKIIGETKHESSQVLDGKSYKKENTKEDKVDMEDKIKKTGKKESRGVDENDVIVLEAIPIDKKLNLFKSNYYMDDINSVYDLQKEIIQLYIKGQISDNKSKTLCYILQNFNSIVKMKMEYKELYHQIESLRAGYRNSITSAIDFCRHGMINKLMSIFALTAEEIKQLKDIGEKSKQEIEKDIRMAEEEFEKKVKSNSTFGGIYGI